MCRGRSWKDYLKKHYDEVEVELAINDPPVSVAKIDCKEFNDTCQRLSVKKKYPVMKIFRNGEFSSTYDGLKYKGTSFVGVSTISLYNCPGMLNVCLGEL